MSHATPSPLPTAPLHTLWQHSLPLLLALLSLIIAIIGNDASVALRFERTLILQGEVWRLITGHLVHLGWSHLLLNLAGLALIWGLFQRQLGTLEWWWVWLASTLAVSAGLFFFDLNLGWYVGLSGVLHGLFIAGLLMALRQDPWWGDGALLAVVVAKLAWEQLYGSLPGTSSLAGGNVIVDAHLYGAIGGAVAVLPLLFRQKKIRYRSGKSG